MDFQVRLGSPVSAGGSGESSRGLGGRVYIPLTIVIETELEDVVDIWPGTLGTSASPLNFGGFSGKVGVFGPLESMFGP